MNDPGSWSDFLYQTAELIFCAFFLEFARRRWHPDTSGFLSNQPKRSAVVALTSTFAGVGLIWIIFFSMSGARGTSNGEEWNLSGVISQLILALIMLGPAVTAMYFNREGAETVGFTTRNWGFATIVAITLAVIGFVEVGSERDWKLVFSTVQVWSFVHYAVVGFAEEVLFRGYLQSRLELWMGSIWGWLAASLIMALSHLAQRMVFGEMAFLDALLSSFSLTSLSLFFGFVYMRTRNILAPGILHTFANWLGTL
jgi:membrane protease YdiL (CAAX protease family)